MTFLEAFTAVVATLVTIATPVIAGVQIRARRRAQDQDVAIAKQANEIAKQSTDIDQATQVATASSALITNLQEELRRTTQRVGDLELGRRQDAQIIRHMGDFIDVLEAHIWSGKQPPPPPRPEGI